MNQLSLYFLLTFVFLGSSFAEDKKDEKSIKPAPENLDFSGFQEQLDSYLESVPEERKKIESTRVGIVKNFKKMVQKVLGRSPYEGKIFLKDKVLIGKIVSAEDESLSVIINGEKTVSVKWEELNMRQYSDIFIAEAINKSEKLEAGKIPADAQKSFVKAANYYYALAVFYDWYGNEAASKIFRKKALILNPDLKTKIDDLWPPAKEL